MIIQYLITGLIAYLLGTIHPSYYLCKKIKKIDIREHGSKNAGTSNVTMLMGWKLGVLTAVIDVLKGFFAVLIAIWIYGYIPSLVYFAALCAVYGHMFPFYMNFKGGKGTATVMGAMIGINFWLTLVLFIVLVCVTILTDYIVIGTACICIGFFAYTFIKYGLDLPSLFAFIIIFSILFKHRNNFVRLYRKEEFKVSAAFKKKDK